MAMTRKSDLLFVYGTLMSVYEGEFAFRLRTHAELLGQATCKGRLYLVSWYPGFVPDPTASNVWGELYALNEHAEEVFCFLDEYEGLTNKETLEGDEYHRRLVNVQCGELNLLAWTYIYVGTNRNVEIAGGKFALNHTHDRDKR